MGNQLADSSSSLMRNVAGFQDNSHRSPQQQQHQYNGHHHQHHSHFSHQHLPRIGQLHRAAGHTRFHASSRHTDACNQQLLGAKSIGVLRRIMVRYKANMGPQHVVNTLLCLQQCVLRARQQATQQTALTKTSAASAQQQGQQHHSKPAALGSDSSIRFSPATSRASRAGVGESEGPSEQLMAQMLGELGNMVWHMMGDMTGSELAICLYSWARLQWHPEAQLLADVRASFISAAEQHQRQWQATSVGVSGPYVPFEQWLASGLWGLAKLDEMVHGPCLQLLLQHWRGLLPLWSPQQLADVARALVLSTDQQAAADAASIGFASSSSLFGDIMPVLLGMAQEMVQQLQLQQIDLSTGTTSAIAASWPESLLLVQPGRPAAAQPGATAAADSSNMLASGSMPGAAEAARKMLLTLKAAGVAPHDSDSSLGRLVAKLRAAAGWGQPMAA
eukprot:GHRR01018815.1.p1 GENE.GHRR01018815.1~~GHRR01018815.1.p1  ORF type:complete len:447 (+),score=179.55 GHRR01018815.1:519-1859(+)